MIRNVGDIRKGHARFLAALEKELIEGLRQGGAHALDHVARHVEFTRRTGKLQDSTKAHVGRRQGKGLRLRLTNRVRYAAPIEYGARPHVIRPRRAKALRFVSKGKIVFARKVNHPGNRPYKFLYRAWTATNRTLDEELDKRMAKLARRF